MEAVIEDEVGRALQGKPAAQSIADAKVKLDRLLAKGGK
jgi:hypothetical protein